jgi:hypothetical protein
MKVYLQVLFLFCSTFLIGQNPSFKIADSLNAGATVNNSTIFNHAVTALQTDQHKFGMVNLTASTITLTVRKYEDLINTVTVGDAAIAVFCTGSNCFPPNIFTTTVAIGPAQTLSFYGDLTEASVAGASTVRYKFTNNATAESITMSLKYNQSGIGITEWSKLINSTSDVFPNPSNGSAFITLQATTNTDIKVKITNLLGKVVSETTESMTEGKNKIVLDTQNLGAGIYFISLGKNEAIITRKLTIK